MNQISGAETLVQMSKLHGVEPVFGLCGDTTPPFYDVLCCTGDGKRHIFRRDERHAAYTEDGYARVSGTFGICEGPSGGGATYILPSNVEANEFSIPILAITTDISVTGCGKTTMTEPDQNALYRSLT